MNKVIFLDIDGTLVNRRAHIVMKQYIQHSIGSFDPISIGLVNELCALSGAMLVISSPWRLLVPNLRAILEDEGLQGLFHNDWKTEQSARGVHPIATASSVRGDEIKAWLDKHPEIDTYVALNNGAAFRVDMYQHWIMTDRTDGISYDNYTRALTILGLKDNEDK